MLSQKISIRPIATLVALVVTLFAIGTRAAAEDDMVLHSFNKITSMDTVPTPA